MGGGEGGPLLMVCGSGLRARGCFRGQAVLLTDLCRFFHGRFAPNVMTVSLRLRGWSLQTCK